MRTCVLWLLLIEVLVGVWAVQRAVTATHPCGLLPMSNEGQCCPACYWS